MNIKIAILICSNTLGGHELQALELAKDLSNFDDVTVIINHKSNLNLFMDNGFKVILKEGMLLSKGFFLKQVLNGFKMRNKISLELHNFDFVIVSAGALEASIQCGISLFGFKRSGLYIPFLYDRRTVWGFFLGESYNRFISIFFELFDLLISINKIQSHIISCYSRRPVYIIPNRVRNVTCNDLNAPGRLVIIGRIDHQKRIHELLNWIDFSDIPFRNIIIIGDGPLMNSLYQFSLNLKYINVHFMGWLSPEEQDLLLSKHDILLLNSKLEGEPLVIREANIRGMRVISRDIDGVRGISRRNMRYQSKPQLQNLILKQSLHNDHEPNFSFHALSNSKRYLAVLNIYKKISLILK
jgi:hypothetical protein